MTEAQMRYLLLAALALVAVAFVWRWYALERARQRSEPLRPHFVDTVVGFVTNFFDTLGIGSFASTTAVLKMQRRMPDEQIPGTLNAGYTLPTLAQALIFTVLVKVDLTTLISMIAAAVLGSWLGAGVVARLPRRAIQLGLGGVLVVAALLFLSANMGWTAAGGTALALSDGRLVFAIAVNFVLGALMTLGLGLYGPCLILVSLLGMDPRAAFPIMMSSCAFLMPVCSLRFMRLQRYDVRASIGMALGAIPGVLIAAFIVKSLPLVWLRWLVVVVVLYAATLMLASALRRSPPSQESALGGPMH